MKRLLALVLAGSIALSISACSGTAVSKSAAAASAGSASAAQVSGLSGDPIKIGVLTTMTGEKAMMGVYCKSSVNLAVEEINKSGGVLGRPVEAVFADDQGMDAGAVNAYNKLVSDKSVVSVIGSNGSTLNLAIANQVAKAQVPTIAEGSSVKLSKLNNEWMFQARSNDATSAAGIARYAAQKLGLKKLAILHDTDPASQGQADAAAATLKELGLQPVVDAAYNTGAKDFTPQIVQIQQSGADGIIACSLQVEAGLILKQLKVMGVKLPLIGTSSFASTICLDLAGSSSEGIYSVVDFVPATTRPKGIEYTKKIREITQKDPDFSGAVSYDAFYLLTEAVKRAGGTENTKIRDAMHTITSYEGATTVFDFKGKNVGGTGVLIVQVQSGKAKVLDTVSVK